MNSSSHVHQTGPPRVRPHLSSPYLYQLARVAWAIILVSFAFDFAFIAAGKSLGRDSSRNLLISLCIFIPVAALTLNQTGLVKRIHRLKRSLGSGERLERKAVPVLAIVVVGILALAKLLAPVLFIPETALWIIPATAVLASIFILRFIKFTREDEHKTHIQPMLQIERWNVQTFLMVGVPLVATRAISAVSAAAYGTGLISEATYLGYFFLAIVLFLSGRPLPGSFISRCRTCWRPTSIAITVVFGHCPSCNEDFYSVIHEGK